MLDPGIGYVVVSGFALLFAHAALAKWRSIGEFRAVLENYRLFPRPLVGALAVVVPALEAGIALALLAAVSRPVAAVAGAALLLAYAAAIGVNLRRGRYDLDCGCSGPGNRRPIAPWMLGRNVLFAAALAALVPPWASRALGWIDVVTVVGGLAVLVLLYAAADRLLGQVMPRTASLRGAR
jgi:hypothetical protein